MRPCAFLTRVNLTDDEAKARTFADRAACQVWADVLNEFSACSEDPFSVSVSGQNNAFVLRYRDQRDLFVARD